MGLVVWLLIKFPTAGDGRSTVYALTHTNLPTSVLRVLKMMELEDP